MKLLLRNRSQWPQQGVTIFNSNSAYIHVIRDPTALKTACLLKTQDKMQCLNQYILCF